MAADTWVLMLRLIAALYAVYGLGSLVTFFAFVAYGPQQLPHPFAMVLSHFAILVFPFANAVVCILIVYSLWNLRHWARYLVGAYNGFYLAAMAFGFIYTRITQPEDLPLQGGIVVLFAVLLLGGVTWLVFHREVRGLMR